MKGKSYRFDKIIHKICDCLNKKQPLTPTEIGREIGISPRTAKKYALQGKNLGLFEIDNVATFYFVKFNPKYKEIWEKEVATSI